MAYVRDRRYGRRRRRQRNQLILLSVILVILLAVIVGIVIGIVKENRPDNTEDTSVTESTETGTENDTQDDERAEINAIIAEADLLAAGYDYDAAIAKIQSIEGYEQDGELLGKIVDYEAIKASCKRVKISEVTHIFYHSLVVDPDRAFDPNKSNGEGKELKRELANWMVYLRHYPGRGTERQKGKLKHYTAGRPCEPFLS